MNIDFSKYKRVFTFGCSFTKWAYPTWANILSKCMPDATFLNLGQSGGGNSFISNRMTQAHRKYNFCETDLVLTMWSTLCREDRFCNGRWMTPGNIFSQGEYDEEFVKKFCEPLGYLIKDLSIIDLATTYLSTLPCTYIDMISVPFNHQITELDDATYQDVIQTYRGLIEHFDKVTLLDSIGGEWRDGLLYVHSYDKEKIPRVDYHPHTLFYREYLEKIGINLTDAAIEYAETSYAKARLVKHQDEFGTLFPETKVNFNWGWKI